MGKRDRDRGNIENISPQRQSFLASDFSLQSDMKTRSTSKVQVQPTDASAVPPAPNAEQYPTAVLLQEMANTASTSSVIEIEVPYEVSGSNRSPLAESSYNELTPEKKDARSSPKVMGLTNINAQATPTANLKILCDAVDHDETVTSEPTIVHSVRGDEPVTPTTNLKMLITAASPEIRSLEMSKSRLFTDEDEDDDDPLDDCEMSKKSSKALAAATRKQKSLGILCRRLVFWLVCITM